MKLLFLDLDGVLNNYKTQTKVYDTYVPFLSDLEPECMNNLVTLLQAHPDYRIVIHSAWREDMTSFKFKEIFNELGYHYISDRIFGIANSELPKADAIYEMIQMVRATNYVIIDDDMLFNIGEELHKHQYKTSLFTGLS